MCACVYEVKFWAEDTEVPCENQQKRPVKRCHTQKKECRSWDLNLKHEKGILATTPLIMHKFFVWHIPESVWQHKSTIEGYDVKNKNNLSKFEVGNSANMRNMMLQSQSLTENHNCRQKKRKEQTHYFWKENERSMNEKFIGISKSSLFYII